MDFLSYLYETVDHIEFNGNMRKASDFENKKTIDNINKTMDKANEHRRLGNKVANGAVKSTKWSDYENYDTRKDAIDRHNRKHPDRKIGESTIDFI